MARPRLTEDAQMWADFRADKDDRELERASGARQVRYESNEDFAKRKAELKKGRTKFMGRWRTKVEIAARLLSDKSMRGAIMGVASREVFAAHPFVEVLLPSDPTFIMRLDPFPLSAVEFIAAVQEELAK